MYIDILCLSVILQLIAVGKHMCKINTALLIRTGVNSVLLWDYVYVFVRSMICILLAAIHLIFMIYCRKLCQVFAAKCVAGLGNAMEIAL